jgi:extradiol dioxygenase family protein
MKFSSILTSFTVTSIFLFSQASIAELTGPNDTGVAMGHLHYTVQDIEANRQFWLALGGSPDQRGGTQNINFPNIIISFSQGETSGGTEGSVINHVAFRVESLQGIEDAGFDVEYLEEYPGVASVFTPEGERIELFGESATNLYFTVDEGEINNVADRHNQKIPAPIVSHHIHLNVPEEDVLAAKNWYVENFGATAGKRWRYEAADLPGINFNFSAAEETLVATQGRMLDHIGFEIQNLENFCQLLEAKGIKFDIPYQTLPSGIKSAYLTDPWGTFIELTEGLQ